MHDLLIFCAGAGFAFTFVWVITALEHYDRRRQPSRCGFFDFTVMSSDTEGRDASADPDDSELSLGAATSRRPSHLQMVPDDDQASPSGREGR